MLCERCRERQAEIHIRHLKNGKTVEFHLCHKCAEDMSRKGLLPDLSFDMPAENLIAGLFPQGPHGNGAPDTIEEAADPAVNVTCPSCGLDYAGFRKSGKFGCADCYVAFSEQVRPLLRKIHGSESHRGARPAVSAVQDASDPDVKTLKARLREAVDREEYERAADLRDRIRMLEGISG